MYAYTSCRWMIVATLGKTAESFVHWECSDSTILRVYATLLQDLFDRLVLVDSAPKRSALLNYQEAHLFGLRWSKLLSLVPSQTASRREMVW